MLEASKLVETGAVHCLVLEYQGKDSTLVKLELTSELIGGLRNIAKSDF